jgi:DNA ligase-1
MFANLSHHEGGKITIESRNGSPFPIDAFPEIVKDALQHLPEGFQTHGELLVAIKKMSGLVYLPRQEGNGMLNKLLKGGELPPGHMVVYEAWDMIPLMAAVTKGKLKIRYADRWAKLQSHMSYCHSIKLIETQIVHSYEEAMRHYQYALSRELEGTIIKHPDMEWKDGTSKEQVKMKLEVSVELRVVGFNEGRNKYVGMLGSLQCESECGKVKVNVAGFSDAQRQEIWDDQEGWLNGVITAKSNSIMPPENKEHYSLFLPIFVEERLDKKKADTLEQIQAQFEAAVSA